MNEENVVPRPRAETPEAPAPAVAEVVDGPSLLDFCDRKELSLRARLDLFLQVCAAVQQAHEKGVFHHAIEPGNVVVSEVDFEPVPKVVRFAAARVSGSDPTGPAQDIQRDVHGLGVLLSSLLAGLPPSDEQPPGRSADAGPHHQPATLSARLRELGPAATTLAFRRKTTPAELIRQLSGDLEWIVRRALEASPEGSYPSVAEFAADIERHLQDLPILAGPPRPGTRLVKFARRHRVGVVVAGLVGLALVGAGVVTSLSRAKSRQVEARAAAEAAKDRTVADFLNRMLGSSSPDELGVDVEDVELLDRAAAEISERFATEPEVEAALRAILGATYERLGEAQKGLRELDEAISLTARVHGARARPTLVLQGKRGFMLVNQGRLAEAEKDLSEVVGALSKLAEPTDEDLLAAQLSLAWLYREMANYEAAEAQFRALSPPAGEASGKPSRTALRALSGLALVLHDQDRRPEAEAVYADLLGRIERSDTAEQPSTLVIRNNYGSLLLDLGKIDQAEALVRTNLAAAERIFGPEHMETFSIRHHLVKVLTLQRRFDAAEPIAREVLAARLRTLGPEHPQTFSSRLALADVLGQQKRYGEAEAVLLAAHEDATRALGPQHDLVGLVERELRKLYAASGKPAPAWLPAEVPAAP